MINLSIVGRIGKDATVNTPNGKTVINFSVAHTDKFNGQEKTTWVDCSYWSDKQGIVPYLKKGTQVFVSGSPEVRTFQKNDGTAGASLTVRVREIELLGSRQEAPATASAGTSADGPADDLPF